MTELVETTKMIIRSLCAERPDEIDQAHYNYLETEFSLLSFEGVYKRLLETIQEFYGYKGGPPQLPVVCEFLERKGEQETVLVAREIAVLSARFGSGYIDLLDRYNEFRGLKDLKSLLSESNQISEDGLVFNKKEYRGLMPALSHLVSGGVEIQQRSTKKRRVISSDDVEGEMLSLLQKKKEADSVIGASTGLEQIDNVTRGGHPGELWLIGGYAKHGKSTLAANWCRYVAMEGSWNVLYITLEMRSYELWEVILAAHSHDPKWGRPPLLHTEITSGRFLNKDNEIFYRESVLRDFSSSSVGQIKVEQPSGQMTISSIWGRAETINQIHPLDMIVIDYLALLDPEKGMERSSHHDIVTHNLKKAKQMALEFDRGHGVLVVVPHQLSRTGMKEAEKRGGIYTTDAFADTAEAERSADVLMTIYRDDDMKKNQEALICLLANRKGPLVDPFMVYAPFEYRYVSNLRGGVGAETLMRV